MINIVFIYVFICTPTNTKYYYGILEMVLPWYSDTSKNTMVHEFQSSIAIQYHYCTMVLPQDTRLYFIYHGTEVHLYGTSNTMVLP